MRRTFALLLAAAVVLAGCTAAPGTEPTPPSVPAPEPAEVAAFYGDSYTAGMGASDPARRWSTLLAADRGWQEVNPSIPGLGFVTNREAYQSDLPAEIIAADPDVMIVTLGLNDVYSYDTSAAEIRSTIAADLRRLSDELPDARLVVVEPFWWSSVRPQPLEVIIGWVRDAAASVDADYIEGASRWIEDAPTLMAADGAHPNDEGYELIYRRMAAELRDLDL